MRDEDRQTRSRLMRLFEQQGRQPRHDLGQNFLVDLNLHELIVKHARLSPADVVLEVGTGTGGLTAALAHSAGHVVSVEFDEHVYGHAKHLLAGRSNVTLIPGDALANKSTIAPSVIEALETALTTVRAEEQAAFPDGNAGFENPPLEAGDDNHEAVEPETAEEDDFWVLKPRQTSLKLAANLPYNIATPLMSNLVASDLPWSLMVVTIQLELAERMLAQPGTRDYSALTVWMQAQSRMKLVRKLPPGVFWPPPKVDSAVLKVERDEERQNKIADREFFQEWIRQMFTLRRKRMAGVLRRNWLCHLADEAVVAIMESVGLNSDSRIEQVPVAALVDLATKIQGETQAPPQGGEVSHDS